MPYSMEWPHPAWLVDRVTRAVIRLHATRWCVHLQTCNTKPQWPAGAVVQYSAPHTWSDRGPVGLWMTPSRPTHSVQTTRAVSYAGPFTAMMHVLPYTYCRPTGLAGTYVIQRWRFEGCSTSAGPFVADQPILTQQSFTSPPTQPLLYLVRPEMPVQWHRTQNNLK